MTVVMYERQCIIDRILRAKLAESVEEDVYTGLEFEEMESLQSLTSSRAESTAMSMIADFPKFKHWFVDHLVGRSHVRSPRTHRALLFRPVNIM